MKSQNTGAILHELGILRQIVRTVERIAVEKEIREIRHITLEVGRSSGVVPRYLTKLFPVAADGCPALEKAKLRIEPVEGSGLFIKEIGY